jgi:hypothetical protein
MRIFSFTTVTIALVLCCSSLRAQVYSYFDANGVRVFTNIPPSGAVQDLKISGAPLAPPAPKPVPPGKIPARGVKVGESAEGTGHPVSSKVAPSGFIPNSGAGAPAPVSSSKVTSQSNGDPVDYDEIIEKYAREYDLDPNLIRLMIAAESGFNAKAVSPKGAQGLMQLMPATAARLGVSKPFDPEENISGGTRYLRFLLDTFSYKPYKPEETLILSLAAYNAGENLVQRLGRIPDFRETNEYVGAIIQRYGSRKMEVTVRAAPAIIGPSTFHYLDDQGVLILTNIPPVDRSKNSNPTQGPNSIFR